MYRSTITSKGKGYPNTFSKKSLPFQKYSKLLEFLMVCLLLLVSFFSAYHAMKQHRAEGAKQIDFYQMFFEPAVFMACRNQFATMDPPVNFSDPFEVYFKKDAQSEPKGPLYEFLALKRDHLSCTEIANLQPTVTDPPQRFWYYLLTTVGQFWKFTGISWTALDQFVSLAFALSIALFYGIFRLGMNIPVSLVCTVLLSGSTLQLTFLPWLRDYAKAPFFLAVILILGIVVSKPLTKKSLFLYAGLCGAIIGIGYGFRSDLLVMFLPAVFTFLFFIKGPILGQFFKKSLAICLLLITLVLSMQPTLPNNKAKGGCMMDNAIMGFSPSFSEALKVVPSPLYEIAHVYNDILIYALVGSHADQFLHLDLNKDFKQPYTYRSCTKNYDKASISFYKEILQLMPADFVLRGFSSALQILNLSGMSWQESSTTPWQNMVLKPNHSITNKLYQISRPLFELLAGKGLVLLLLTIFCLGVFERRLALFSFLLVAYLSTYPSLQFNPRNYFYLEFISLWCLGFLCYQSYRFIRSSNLQYSFYFLIRRLVFSGLTIACVSIVALLIYQQLEKYQMRKIQNLVMHYQQSEKIPLEKVFIAEGEDKSLVQINDPAISDFMQYQGESAKGAMLLLEFSQNNFPPKENLSLQIEYEMDKNLYDFFNLTKTTQVTLSSHGKTFIYLPIYQSRFFRFKGLRLESQAASSLKAIYQIKNNEPLPWIFLNLPPHWQSLPFTQILKSSNI